MMTDGFFISLFVAGFGGMLSFLSPCVLPLVPGYLCFAAGMELNEFQTADRSTFHRHILPPILAFIFGFSLVFIAFGASAAALNPFLLAHQNLLGKMAGIIIMLLGLHIMGLWRMGFLAREVRFATPLLFQNKGQNKGQNGWRLVLAFIMGLAFAFGWTPCIGPILAGILALAATQDSAHQGIILLAAYAAGLGLPFLLAAYGMGWFLQTSPKIKTYHRVIELITGGLLATTGLFIFLGSLQQIGTWLLDWLPFLSVLG